MEDDEPVLRLSSPGAESTTEQVSSMSATPNNISRMSRRSSPGHADRRGSDVSEPRKTVRPHGDAVGRVDTLNVTFWPKCARPSVELRRTRLIVAPPPVVVPPPPRQ